MIITVAAGAPDWASIMTAFGTLAAAGAALWIALWSDRRTGRRIKAEHEIGDARLAKEQAHSRALVEEEQEHSRARIEEEHRLAREREQLAEAYAVQVVLGQRPVGGEPNVYGDLDGSVKRLAVMVINHGSFTITRLEAQFSYDGKSLTSHRGYERLSGLTDLPEGLQRGWASAQEHAMYGVLTPRDVGMRFESDDVHVQHLKSPYPLVRWTDRWGTRWEHRLGEVRQIADGQEWQP